MIESGDQFGEFAKMIGKNRATRATEMNDTSIRTHCLVHLRLYRKNGDKAHICNYKLFDLCGSEKYGKIDESRFNMGSSSKMDWPIEALEGLG